MGLDVSLLRNILLRHKKLTRLTMSPTFSNNCGIIEEIWMSQIVVSCGPIHRKSDNYWSICDVFGPFWHKLSQEKPIGDSLTYPRATVVCIIQDFLMIKESAMINETCVDAPQRGFFFRCVGAKEYPKMNPWDEQQLFLPCIYFVLTFCLHEGRGGH